MIEIINFMINLPKNDPIPKMDKMDRTYDVEYPDISGYSGTLKNELITPRRCGAKFFNKSDRRNL
jgi:hypothetical protein